MEHNTHFFPLQTQAGKPDNYINVHKGTRSVKSCSIFYFYILTLLFLLFIRIFFKYNRQQSTSILTLACEF